MAQKCYYRQDVAPSIGRNLSYAEVPGRQEVRNGGVKREPKTGLQRGLIYSNHAPRGLVGTLITCGLLEMYVDRDFIIVSN